MCVNIVNAPIIALVRGCVWAQFKWCQANQKILSPFLVQIITKTLYNTMDTNSIVNVYNIMIEYYEYIWVCETVSHIFHYPSNTMLCNENITDIHFLHQYYCERQPKISMSSTTKFVGFCFTFPITSLRTPTSPLLLSSVIQ